ncbi:MAG: type II toxin-antitoxin system Phd/YefM family antitoxin [Gammaproteobacteria bacterium]|nr:type II toxin-antitoxin system Phd/YefM family antitoxin [Gammaproteobacteria bacterium]
METVSINQFKQNLKRFVGRVVAEHAPLKVRDGDEEIVVVSADDWESEQETKRLMQDPEFLRKLDAAAETHAKGAGYRPSKKEMKEILGV